MYRLSILLIVVSFFTLSPHSFASDHDKPISKPVLDSKEKPECKLMKSCSPECTEVCVDSSTGGPTLCTKTCTRVCEYDCN